MSGAHAHKILVYAAFGFLTLTGSLHFAVDVVSQYLRHKRVPGAEATLYYGLNSAYALGQIAFGMLGLLVARSAIDLLGRGPVIALCLGAVTTWTVIAFVFLEYREPRIAIGVCAALFVGAALT